jgi:hypothetical protein
MFRELLITSKRLTNFRDTKIFWPVNDNPIDGGGWLGSVETRKGKIVSCLGYFDS